MAGQKLDFHESTAEDNLVDKNGVLHLGIPMCIITENGNVEPDDEWALFRLTDDGMYAYYEIGCEMAVGIMGLSISGKPAVEEQEPRYKTQMEAVEAGRKLPLEERKRMLVRSVRPKK